MKRSILAACAALALAGCASLDLDKWAEATAKHGAGCYERKVVKVRPMLVFGWPVPLADYDYEMVCNGGERPASGQSVAVVQPGQVLAVE